ncbi:MAG: FKBP-type peptidyl-prolyl cis-trans isomerase [Salibacteraceae bacterium]
MNRSKAFAWSLLGLWMISLVACQGETYPGYREVRGGGHYKRLTVGDSGQRLKNGDRFDLRISSSATDDSMAWQGQYPQQQQLAFWRVLKILNPGDSVLAILPNDELPDTLKQYFSVTDTLKCLLYLKQIYTPETWKAYQDELALKADAELNEQQAMKRYLDAHQITEEQRYGGIYIVPVEEGRGRTVDSGDYVVAHYRSMFLDSTEFDNSYEAGSPLEFRMGKPDQVLPGFAMGIRTMRLGSKSVFIIPSQLGYGEWGSTTGLVPPYTTTIFEVEVIAIK